MSGLQNLIYHCDKVSLCYTIIQLQVSYYMHFKIIFFKIFSSEENIRHAFQYKVIHVHDIIFTIAEEDGKEKFF